jgi:peptide/nickel transport system substrate-binding protein
MRFAYCALRATAQETILMDRRTFLQTAASAALAASRYAMPAISQRASARALRFVPQADLANFDPVWNTQYVVRNGAFTPVFEGLWRGVGVKGASPQAQTRGVLPHPQAGRGKGGG